MVKKCVCGGLLLGAAALLAAGFVLNQEPAVFLPGSSRDVVRLHVIANSDTQYDQMIKLKVRDAVIAYMAPKLKHASSSAEVNAMIEGNCREIEAVARKVLLLSGIGYPVEVQFGQFDFPVKSYGESVYPAGRYQAVRILLGKAEGSNWWCVLFPPLCLIDANYAVTAPLAENAATPSPRIEFRSKLLEVWQQLN
ncbi:MAG: stage II sporulation protein R [Sporomusaceae bacterium]|nr:stage II sporulation protein R [Sporomusaceae bacterium]